MCSRNIIYRNGLILYWGVLYAYGTFIDDASEEPVLTITKGSILINGTEGSADDINVLIGIIFGDYDGFVSAAAKYSWKAINESKLDEATICEVHTITKDNDVVSEKDERVFSGTVDGAKVNLKFEIIFDEENPSNSKLKMVYYSLDGTFYDVKDVEYVPGRSEMML